MPSIKIYQSIQHLNKKDSTLIIQQYGETVGDAIRRAHIELQYPCGGKGLCGKCRFQLLSGKTTITEEEKNHLSKEQLNRGDRLLCKASFETDGEVLLGVQDTTDKVIASDMGRRQIHMVDLSLPDEMHDIKDYFVAADIGTTTIAMALADAGKSKVVRTLTMNNSGRYYGADVISRMQSACSGAGNELKRLMWKDLLEGIQQLCELQFIPTRLIISANTTMGHLLLGESCEKLGVAPFDPGDITLRTLKVTELLSEDEFTELTEADIAYRNIEVVMMPGISAFVGADIVSGMLECRMDRIEKNVLFLDLGTNGEMVLGNKSGYVATSAAVGPAFEGGNITWGCPGVEGAVRSASMLGQRLVLNTIGKKRPIGICGTGVIDLVYELYKNGMIDEQGRLNSQCALRGYPLEETESGELIVLTQEDIRQLQMAKSAVRSGIELLMKEKGLTPDLVDKVYLAGGLGYKLNVYKAVGIGLIPRVLRDKTEAVGNTSLYGAIHYGFHPQMGENMIQMIGKTKEMNLAAHPEFESCYLKYMNFGF